MYLSIVDPAAGASDDWYESQGSNYTYTWELRPSSAVGGGFQLPPAQIRPSGEEMWAGLRTVLDQILLENP